jgi:ABC-2 type transport system ATP-binding protein
MITIEGVSKQFKGKIALDQVSFTAEDGKVTGFLGPNGAGKSTTMRAALGLLKPDAGRALIDGKPFRESASPMALVGAVLDAKSAHKGRSAYSHLLALALTNGIPRKRVDEVIALTGLESVRKRKAGSFSLGMSQRLSIAAALLGDPHNLVLDEPVNGLDPEGVKWVRELCRFYASQGRAVLLSSHLMSEVALTADNLVIIGQGRILETTSVDRFVAEHSAHAIRVVTPEPDKLRRIFEGANQVQISEATRLSSDPERGAVLRITGAQLERTAQGVRTGPAGDLRTHRGAGFAGRRLHDAHSQPGAIRDARSSRPGARAVWSVVASFATTRNGCGRSGSVSWPAAG